ncbi:MAG: ABC transporter substrate-binding protein [Nitrososphaerota archaeon]
MKKAIVLVAIIFILIISLSLTFMLGKSTAKEYENVSVAVEFNNHAAAAYIAKHFDWFKENGLNITTFNSYVTGVALANALARGDVDAAYVCLGPALIAYSKGVDIVIVSGTHLYGYSVVTRREITTPGDLDGKKVGIVEAGSNTDIFFQMVVKKYDLKNIDVRRGNPPLLTTLLWTGQVDAIVVPEHWATMASSKEGFHVLLRSQDVWSGMPGSVLIVKRELLEKRPEVVEKLVKITEKGVKFIEENKEQAAEIIVDELGKASPMGVELKLVEEVSKTLSPSLMLDSMKNLNYTSELDSGAINQYIEFLYDLGYIENKIDVNKIVGAHFSAKG